MDDTFLSTMRMLLKGELSWAALLPEGMVDDACQKIDYQSRGTVYTPIVTILAFMSQVLHGGSCQRSVTELNAERAVGGKKPCSSNTKKRSPPSKRPSSSWLPTTRC